jgi:hypothetical protein
MSSVYWHPVLELYQHTSYPPSPPLVRKTQFSARHVSIYFKSLSSAAFYINHVSDRAQQRQTLVMTWIRYHTVKVSTTLDRKKNRRCIILCTSRA